MPVSVMAAIFAAGMSYAVYNGKAADRRRRELAALALRREVFPSNLVARLAGFEREDFFESEETGLRSAPKAEFP